MTRLLLIIPTTTYRTHDFIEAAHKLNVEVIVGSDQPQALAEQAPGTTLALTFQDLKAATRQITAFARAHPLHAVIPVDDDATLLAAMAAEALGLPHNSAASVAIARNKYRMRQVLREAGIPSPQAEVVSIDDDPATLATRISFPCVVKPLFLSAGRGVIRADDPAGFVAALGRIARLLATPEVAAKAPDHETARQVLVESYLPGAEVALEGLVIHGTLHVLALFDKPDPLEGPFFEETIYVTPSRLTATLQEEIAAVTAMTTKALGLAEGPVHAELRVNPQSPQRVVPLEVAARSIGGLCSRVLRFGTGLSLEDLIIRHALGQPVASFEREKRPAGVMMIPIPQAGVLREVQGVEEAEQVPGIEAVTISIPIGQPVVPLPEGHQYLGFIFARADSPQHVEAALRNAHRRLAFVMTPAG